MSEKESVAPVPDRVIDELADVLLERLDQLLDRFTDQAMAAPTPGSAVWQSEWNLRDTAFGRARAGERCRVRDELVRRAAAGLGSAFARPTSQPARHSPVARTRTAKARRGRVDDAQLAFF